MPRESMQNKATLITAAITAATTIAVSFIGIVPQLRSEDRTKFDSLKKAFDDLDSKFKAASVVSAAPAALEKKITIDGTVRSENGSKPLAGYDIYLLPEGNNLLTAKTDDRGRFTLQEVPTGVYSIIVRDSTNGKSGKALLDDAGDEVQVIGAKVSYRIQK